MLINVIAILIGALILVGGIYYFLKEKGDRGIEKDLWNCNRYRRSAVDHFTIRLIF